MPTVAPALLFELEAAQARVAPILEGLKVLRVLARDPASVSVFRRLTDNAEDIASLLEVQIQGLRSLLARGFPDFPALVVPADVFADVQDGKAAVELAAAQVRLPGLVSGHFQFETPTLQSGG